MRNAARCLAAAIVVLATALVAPAAFGRVLLVGSFHGVKGQYKSLQPAVNAAHRGDWILIGPGDYKTSSSIAPYSPYGESREGSGILIRTPGIHVRGMDRNATWIDGTKPGSPRCSNATADQNLGPADAAGKPAGLDGVVVYKVSGVTLENFSVCNFLSGSGGGGDLVWFDGGGGSGTQTSMSFQGNYLSATSTYYQAPGAPAATYGIYSSNTKGGPGLFSHDYANNMDDSSFYVGACPNCAVTLDHVHGQNSVLGYSGTNSGGNLVVKNSEFDHNQDGFDTNSENGADLPPPQNGSCAHGGLGPRPAGTQQAHSCWVFENNYIHDNNNPNVPSTGVASNGPVGTGMTISGGRNDIVVHNRFARNGAWGLLLVPFPDTAGPSNCISGGGSLSSPFGPSVCYFDVYGNEIANNTFSGNGFFGNPSNGDVGEISGTNTPGNCWHGNTDPKGALTSDPANIQSTHGRCGATNTGNGIGSTLTAQVLCATQLFGDCPSVPGQLYPRRTAVPMPAMPRQQSMANPCAGVPSNPWCGGGRAVPKLPAFTGTAGRG